MVKLQVLKILPSRLDYRIITKNLYMGESVGVIYGRHVANFFGWFSESRSNSLQLQCERRGIQSSRYLTSKL